MSEKVSTKDQLLDISNDEYPSQQSSESSLRVKDRLPYVCMDVLLTAVSARGSGELGGQQGLGELR